MKTIIFWIMCLGVGYIVGKVSHKVEEKYIHAKIKKQKHKEYV